MAVSPKASRAPSRSRSSPLAPPKQTLQAPEEPEAHRSASQTRRALTLTLGERTMVLVVLMWYIITFVIMAARQRRFFI